MARIAYDEEEREEADDREEFGLCWYDGKKCKYPSSTFRGCRNMSCEVFKANHRGDGDNS